MTDPLDERTRILQPVLLALTAATGVIDAVSYLGLGRVFTANMTGNVVLLGFAVAGAQGLSVTRSGIALLAFFVGAVIGGRTARSMSDAPWQRWTRVAFGAEAGLLLLATTFAIGQTRSLDAKPARLSAVIILTAAALGIRNATVRKLAVPDLTTTVLTLTVTGLAADSTLAGGVNQGFAKRSAAVVLMLAGAAVGAWLVEYSLALALAACAIAAGCCALAVGRATVDPPGHGERIGS